MSQISRAFLGLALAASVAGGLVFFAMRATDAPAPRSAFATSRAFDFARDGVFAIDIHKGGQTLHLEKRGADWFVQSPIQMQAADDKIQGLIDSLLELRPLTPWDDADAAPKHADVGLSSNTPDTWVQFFDAKAFPLASVHFGIQSEYNQMRYAAFRASNESPWLGMVPQAAVQTLIPSLQTVLERRVLGAGHQQVLRLKVRYIGDEQEPREFELERVLSAEPEVDPSDSFILRMPHAVDADRRRAHDVLRAFSATPVARFLTFQHQNRYADYELEPAAIEVEAELATRGLAREPQKEIRKLRIGKPRENKNGVSTLLVARESPPWVGEINAALYYALAISPDDLVDTRILRFDSSKVFGVLLEDQDLRITFHRQQEQGKLIWRAGNSGKQVAEEKIQSLLLTFSDLFGDQRIYPGNGENLELWLQRLGFDKEKASKLVFFDPQGKTLAELLLGRQDEDGRLVRRPNTSWVARLPEVKMQSLPAEEADFWIGSP